ncbi:hypothetical protein AAG906_025663 [Vitis piasezkii]
MGVDRKRGFEERFLCSIPRYDTPQHKLLWSSFLKVNSTTSWCNGSVDECLTMDLDFDLFMGSEISRMLAPISFVTPGSENPDSPAVSGPKGTAYADNLPPPSPAPKCDPHQNRGCQKFYRT